MCKSSCSNNKKRLRIAVFLLKGHWTTLASSPIFFFFKKVEIFIPLEVYTYVVTECLILLANSSLLLKMVATVMTVEFGTIHHYSSPEENSEVCLCSSLNRYKN